ncbi:hypothetical protein SLINC_3708 [Streptomyces lincolnensis]|uniref:Uncharacterized protein n=1 Tax=Streptomyces lincolnensis TaxID=1915 RepID=A0A1B1MBZ8_STRLN|nr:hypothetical protein [Streptomyces lincolnensis]ANS65932.1 hypothetical protein SLINC_3708 [Streptomyces lincolnensis]AXG54305.1 hypothetical protein SLCG_3150 [Streptomyces lincolnensis]QMV08677.1 hypothetical protein GJU35_25565 [Streptomyces lincolnensis]
MRTKRSLLGAVGTMTLVLASVLASGTAQAASSAASAVAPTISPAADSRLVPAGSHITCDTGNFCAGVWDPTVNQWRVFFLYHCNRYHLSNWQGTGEVVNSQTDNAQATTYGQNGNVIQTFPVSTDAPDVDWDPVWSIRNC